MRVGILQFSPVFADKTNNFNKIIELVNGNKLDLLVLPELFSTGYLFLSRDELEFVAEPFETGETSAFLRELSQLIDGAVYGGFVEKDGARFFNSAGFFTSDGKSFLYRKSHLFMTEKDVFDRGDIGAVVLEWSSVRFGLAICFDWFFPEFFRTLALKGADIIVHCANLVLPYFEYAAPIRALENRVFIVSANRTGKETRNEKNIEFTGRSLIVSPTGQVLLRTEKDKEGLFFVEIDPFEARNKNMTPKNNIFEDRRPDLYEI